MQIREDRERPVEAKELRLMCPHCHGCIYVKFSWPITAVSRNNEMKLAIEEHRPLCTGAPPEAGRVYEISYPRA